jgi:uncharacterized protein YutE (UPF0331/DUF86 family)
MYFVDREQIEATLQFLDKQINFYENQESWISPMEKSALERTAHTMIEAVLDVGNAMIDGFIMRDPGSYEDIIDILDDEKVVTADMSKGLKRIVQFRKILVQQYTDINHASLQQAFTAELSHLKLFSAKVREYLTNELGPVSAFKK